MQPGYSIGRYDPRPITTMCPICDASNRGNARLIQSGTNVFRCDFGHLFTFSDVPLPPALLPVSVEKDAETRIDLVQWQQLMG